MLRFFRNVIANCKYRMCQNVDDIILPENFLTNTYKTTSGLFSILFLKKTSHKTKLSLILVPIPDFEKHFLFHNVSCILWAWQQTSSAHQFHLWWLSACLCFPLSHPIWWLEFSHCSYPPLFTILKMHKESLSKYVCKIFRKTNISNPLNEHACESIWGLEMLVFRKILRTYLMDESQQAQKPSNIDYQHDF